MMSGVVHSGKWRQDTRVCALPVEELTASVTVPTRSSPCCMGFLHLPAGWEEDGIDGSEWGRVQAGG